MYTDGKLPIAVAWRQQCAPPFFAKPDISPDFSDCITASMRRSSNKRKVRETGNGHDMSFHVDRQRKGSYSIGPAAVSHPNKMDPCKLTQGQWPLWILAAINCINRISWHFSNISRLTMMWSSMQWDCITEER